MAKELLSIRDENTILITARFIFEHNEGFPPLQYDFDFIVKNDITVDKLLNAIACGLRKEAKVSDEEMEEISQMQFVSMDVRYDFSKDIENISENIKQMESEEDDSEREIYRKCLGLFLKCIQSYVEDNYYEDYLYYYEDESGQKHLNGPDDSGKRRSQLHRTPHITVDCIDVNKWKNSCVEEEDEKLSVSDAKLFQLGKQKLNGKTLEEIGFVTSTRMVFTDHNAGVQADGKDINIFLFQKEEIQKSRYDEKKREKKWNKTEKIEEQKDIIGVREGYSKTIPLYNISNRPLYQLNTEPVKIIPPTERPKKNNSGNILKALIFPVLMSIIMLVSRSSSSNNKYVTVLYGAMMFLTIITTLWSYRDNKNAFKTALKEWKTHYERYIQRIIYDIVQKQNCDVKQLTTLYPSMLGLEGDKSREYTGTLHSRKNRKPSLVDMCAEIHPDIFTRGKEHPDFLTIRIGVSTEESELVSSVFSVIGEKKEYVFTSERYMNLGNDRKHPFTILLEDKTEALKDSVKNGNKQRETDKQQGKGYLIDLPAAIADKYAYLRQAPVLLKLRECETLGIVLPQKLSFYPILDDIIMNLSFYHSPDDVQMILFCKDFSKDSNLGYLIGADDCPNAWNYRQNLIDKYKHLPHFRELLGDVSAFVFDEIAAGLVFNRLYEILSDRTAREDMRAPHIILIFQEEYEFKRHPISEFLPEYSEKNTKKSNQLSFIFCKNYEEELPKYCGQVILAEEKSTISEQSNTLDGGNYEDYYWYIYPHTQVISRTDTAEIPSKEDKWKYSFKTDNWNLAVRNLDNRRKRLDLYAAYKTLSAIYYYRIAQGVGVPGYVELFDLIEASSGNEEMFAISQEENEQAVLEEKVDTFICQQWGIGKNIGSESGVKSKRNVTESLAVPIGKKSDKELIYLDLHEKADGPHMIVAGTTGSGKTEVILTYLIGLCMLYTPEEVNLLLMDMKGAGFVKRIGELPHVVGKVTDVDGDETGTGMLYMLKRFLQSMTAEVKRRKLYLSKMDVDSVDAYIEAKNDLRKHVENHAKNLKIDLNTPEGQKRFKELEELPQLPHLFVVVDEFTELMRFTSDNADVDFRAEITSLARVGRSLGFHIILISQNIENAITPDIRVNSKARLCLKVATREASKEMIGSDRAADARMPGNGRAYLLVGNGSRFEYFQAGYSGADIIRNLEQPYKVTWAQMNGTYKTFFDSEEDAMETNNNKSEDLSVDGNQDWKRNLNQISATQTKQKSKVTQISLVCSQIDKHREQIKMPRQIFQAPLPACCYYEFNWENGIGKYQELKKPVNERIKRGGLV